MQWNLQRWWWVKRLAGMYRGRKFRKTGKAISWSVTWRKVGKHPAQPHSLSSLDKSLNCQRVPCFPGKVCLSTSTMLWLDSSPHRCVLSADLELDPPFIPSWRSVQSNTPDPQTQMNITRKYTKPLCACQVPIIKALDLGKGVGSFSWTLGTNYWHFTLEQLNFWLHISF